jgi:hypothetical protein
MSELNADTPLPNEFTAKTTFGSFKVKITNRNYINVGGNNNVCFQVGYDEFENEGKIDWLGTESLKCEQSEKIINGVDTVAMADLGLTILRKLYPNIQKWVKLRDSSKFNCTLPDGNNVKISMMILQLLLHGETYYQSRFKAVPVYDEAITAYELFHKAWLNDPLPSRPPFIKNEDLTEMLTPLYKKSKSWKDFFSEIYKIYGRKSCEIIQSWYKDVYGILAKYPITTDWKIDVTTRPMIPFEITNKSSNANYTRKKFKYDPFIQLGGYYQSILKYKGYVSPSGDGKTRKQKPNQQKKRNNQNKKRKSTNYKN